MKTTFLMKSDSVDLEQYTIKDIPGSSGRLDVLARSILSALLCEGQFDINSKLIIFLARYGTFKLDPRFLDYSKFPKNEILLSDSLCKLLKSEDIHNIHSNPLNGIKKLDLSFISFIKKLRIKGSPFLFILKESGILFSQMLKEQRLMDEIYLIIGNQSEDFINSEEFLHFNIPEISLGSKSLLASTTIRLLKLKMALLR
ncbi:MAG: hypothetical protein BAJALOKI1v1_190030 [Promethearchaeota archaeon]|nr:MAG: hypothetical protein BAJALOKI1v1_190030 [Candidatus Lokiarchaeota archaeon]